VAGSTKRLASRFYQLKTSHCLTEQYLNWTKNRRVPGEELLLFLPTPSFMASAEQE
jgi:hypothetical protein